MTTRACTGLGVACCLFALCAASAAAQPSHPKELALTDEAALEGRRTRALRAALPSWVEPVEVPARAPAASEGREVLLVDQQARVEGGQVRRYIHGASRPTALPGLSLSSTIRIELDESYQTYSFHFIRIRREGKVIDAFERTDFRITDAADDHRQRLVLGITRVTAYVRDVRLGDVVEYAYSVNGSQPALRGRYAGTVWLDRSVPIGLLRHRLLWPRERLLHMRNFGTDIAPSIEQDGATDIYTWQIEDVPASPDESHVPSWFDATPWVQISEFGTWSEVARWASPIYEAASRPTPAVRERAEQWLAEHGRAGAAEQAIRFVQDEVHYLGFELGVGSLLPRAPDLTLARRFGDCKDKAVLLVALLGAIGIDAAPALVNSDDLEHVRERLPSPYAFDHVIVKATIDGQPRWIDTTTSFERGPLGKRMNADFGAALLIAKDSQDLESIPRHDLAEPLTLVRETFAVQPDASVRLDVLTRYRYEKASSMRYTFATAPLDEIQREYASFYRRMYGELDVASPISVADDEANDTLDVRESYVLTSLWDDGAEVYAWLLDDRLPDTDEPDRRAPLSLSSSLYVRHEIEVELPRGFDSHAEDENIAGKHFQYTYSAEYEPQKLSLSYELRTLERAVLASELEEYRTLLKRTYPTQRYRVVRTEDEPPPRVLSEEELARKRTSGAVFAGIMLTVLSGFGIWGLVAIRSGVRERLRKRRFFSRFKADEGETPETALRVASLAELEQHMARLRCSCADRPVMTKARDATLIQYMGEPLWNQAARCTTCHHRTTRYFRVEEWGAQSG